MPLRPLAREPRGAALGHRAARAAPLHAEGHGRPRSLVEASRALGAWAAFIEWLVQKSGWTVEEEPAQRVPVEPRHVCILFKRLREYGGVDVPRPYAQALEARRVPHVLVGGRSFHVREEVMALRTALWAIERPDDELSVYATLQGPLLRLERRAAARLSPPGAGASTRCGRSRPRSTAPAATEVVAALGVLGRAAPQAKPTAGGFDLATSSSRPRGPTPASPSGPADSRRWPTCSSSPRSSRRHEQRATSFRDVVEALEEEAEEGEAPEAPIVEEGTEGVRMMTVHAAKGLEFPVVMLAEPTAAVTRPEPSHWVDPDVRPLGARPRWLHPLAAEGARRRGARARSRGGRAGDVRGSDEGERRCSWCRSLPSDGSTTPGRPFSSPPFGRPKTASRAPAPRPAARSSAQTSSSIGRPFRPRRSLGPGCTWRCRRGTGWFGSIPRGSRSPERLEGAWRSPRRWRTSRRWRPRAAPPTRPGASSTLAPSGRASARPLP